MAWASLPSLYFRWPIESREHTYGCLSPCQHLPPSVPTNGPLLPITGMMPRGRVRRILRNTAWGTFATYLHYQRRGYGQLGSVDDIHPTIGRERRMDHEEVGRYWDEKAEVWTELVRAGYDYYRDGLNTPAFLEMLPDVNGLSGLDVGCGEGYNTRLLARRGASMTGIDISRNFVNYAREAGHPLGIRYEIVS